MNACNMGSKDIFRGEIPSIPRDQYLMTLDAVDALREQLSIKTAQLEAVVQFMATLASAHAGKERLHTSLSDTEARQMALVMKGGIPVVRSNGELMWKVPMATAAGHSLRPFDAPAMFDCPPLPNAGGSAATTTAAAQKSGVSRRSPASAGAPRRKQQQLKVLPRANFVGTTGSERVDWFEERTREGRRRKLACTTTRRK